MHGQPSNLLPTLLIELQTLYNNAKSQDSGLISIAANLESWLQRLRSELSNGKSWLLSANADESDDLIIY